MHLNSLLVFALVFCAQHVFAVREMPGSAGKSLLQSIASLSVGTRAAGRGSSASASGSTVVSGPGSVTVAAESAASEFSVTEAGNLLATAIASAIPEIESGADVKPLADFAASVFAEAIAKAFIDATSVSIVSTGDGGSACGQATIPPDQAAKDAAEVLIEVLTQASDLITIVDRTEAIDAIAAVTVADFDDAQKRLCVSGVDQAISSSSELASAIEMPYAQVIDVALLLVDPLTTPLASFTVSLSSDADGQPVLGIGQVSPIANVDG